jgi:hypothetical protein
MFIENTTMVGSYKQQYETVFFTVAPFRIIWIRVNHLKRTQTGKIIFYTSLNIKYKRLFTKHTGRVLHCYEYMR